MPETALCFIASGPPEETSEPLDLGPSELAEFEAGCWCVTRTLDAVVVRGVCCRGGAGWRRLWPAESLG